MTASRATPSPSSARGRGRAHPWRCGKRSTPRPPRERRPLDRRRCSRAARAVASTSSQRLRPQPRSPSRQRGRPGRGRPSPAAGTGAGSAGLGRNMRAGGAAWASQRAAAARAGGRRTSNTARKRRPGAAGPATGAARLRARVTVGPAPTLTACRGAPRRRQGRREDRLGLPSPPGSRRRRRIRTRCQRSWSGQRASGSPATSTATPVRRE